VSDYRSSPVFTKLDVTQLITSLLPDSPGWYVPASSVTHSRYWGCGTRSAPPLVSPWPWPRHWRR